MGKQAVKLKTIKVSYTIDGQEYSVYFWSEGYAAKCVADLMQSSIVSNIWVDRGSVVEYINVNNSAKAQN